MNHMFSLIEVGRGRKKEKVEKLRATTNRYLCSPLETLELEQAWGPLCSKDNLGGLGQSWQYVSLLNLMISNLTWIP